MTQRLFLFASCLLMTTSARTQSFRMQADVGLVTQSGYGRILLPPEVVGRLNADLTDVRLYDRTQREVPYQLTRRQPDQLARSVDFQLISRTILPNQRTTLVLRNPNRGLLRSINVQVKNAAVRKKAQLSGSPDARNWYALVDDVDLRPTGATTQATAHLRIDIPTSDYPYYRLTIRDSLSEPLNIVGVSYDSTTVVPGAYTTVDKVTFTQQDSSDQKTYIRVTRPQPTRLDGLKLEFSTQGRFIRHAVVGQYRIRKHRRGRSERYFDVVQALALTSSDRTLIDLPGGLNTRELYVVIDNGDSPPLRVRGVEGVQVRSFLTANLKANEPYQLRFSADNVPAPRYDLADFRQPVDANSAFISVTNIRPINPVVGDTWGFVLPRWFVWVGLSLVLALLAYFSVQMLREMGKQSA